jgi:hypothetical protein
MNTLGTWPYTTSQVAVPTTQPWNVAGLCPSAFRSRTGSYHETEMKRGARM